MGKASVQILVGSLKGGAEISPELEAKIPFSSSSLHITKAYHTCLVPDPQNPKQIY